MGSTTSSVKATVLPHTPENPGFIEIHFIGDVDLGRLNRVATRIRATKRVKDNVVTLQATTPHTDERARREEGNRYRDRILEQLKTRRRTKEKAATT